MHCINCMEHAAVSGGATTFWNQPCVHRATGSDRYRIRALQDQSVERAGVARCMAGNGRIVPVKPDTAVVVGPDDESHSMSHPAG